MALCFASVVILSFFTGITIGYITFEFYIVKKNKVTFNFIEGDEVDNFLEEIRKSKDNGARMLNYGTKPVARSTPESGLNRLARKQNDKKSLSAQMRENMNIEKEESAEIIVDTVVISADGSITTEMDAVTASHADASFEENAVIDEQDNHFMDDEEMMVGDEDLMGGDEYDSDADEFALDYELLKEYYTNEDENDNTVEALDEEENVTDNNDEGVAEVADESIVSTSDEIIVEAENDETEEIALSIEEDMSSIPEDMTNIVTEYDTNDNATVSDDVTEIEAEKDKSSEEKEDTTDKSESITNVVLPTPDTNKNDKIASNVCIPLGGSSTSGQPIVSNVSIPLTMTEKPVEPQEPPKRKRGRPRKNKS